MSDLDPKSEKYVVDDSPHPSDHGEGPLLTRDWTKAEEIKAKRK